MNSDKLNNYLLNIRNLQKEKIKLKDYIEGISLHEVIKNQNLLSYIYEDTVNDGYHYVFARLNFRHDSVID